jgi:hypothetical protein
MTLLTQVEKEINRLERIRKLILEDEDTVVAVPSTRPKRVISAATRKKLAESQRARWAKVKSGK